MEAPRIYPTFRFHDAAAIIDWLEKASGCTSKRNTWTAARSLKAVGCLQPGRTRSTPIRSVMSTQSDRSPQVPRFISAFLKQPFDG